MSPDLLNHLRLAHVDACKVAVYDDDRPRPDAALELGTAMKGGE
jgi:hypothetical protein